MKGIILILFTLVIFRGISQGNPDSLWSVWNNSSQPDSSRAKVLRSLMGLVIRNNPDSAYKIAQLQYDFAVEKGMKVVAGNALVMQGITLDMRGEFDQALSHYNKSLLIYKEINNKTGVALSYNNIAGIYEDRGAYSLAIDYYMKSLKMATELDSKRGISICLTNIATIYSALGDNDIALDYLLRGLQIKKKKIT